MGARESTNGAVEIDEGGVTVCFCVVEDTLNSCVIYGILSYIIVV